ncbi:MAG: peptidylprolyl isomerase [Muribaculaceae bacterium]|nr:peptidylprolyl isomerase [Muribaculaceae bacterium]MDE6360544.1 peptidylprolyl isomerase [Muribaculaceae bacterium]
MEKIQPGKYVELGYDLYAVEPDGTEKLVHQTDAEDPEKIVFGVTQGVIVPLEKAIDGLEKDATFNVTATADEAFGPYDPEQVVTLDKDLFLIDDKFDDEAIKPGALVPMMTADGFRINGLVKEVTADKVKMDFNHPLAGKSVRFDGKILAVRDATPEELHPAHGCGCGCDHDHCGEEHGGGCSDGCCGGGHCH